MAACGTQRTYRDVGVFVCFRGEADERACLASPASVADDPNRTLRTFETSTRWARLRLKPGLDSPEQPEAHLVVIAREQSSFAINSMAISGPDTKPLERSEPPE
jgi:hypothetical protein